MNKELLKAARAALDELRKSAGGPPPPPPPAGPQGPPPKQPQTIPGGGNGAAVPPKSQAKPSPPASLQPGTEACMRAANNLSAWLFNYKGKSSIQQANH